MFTFGCGRRVKDARGRSAISGREGAGDANARKKGNASARRRARGARVTQMHGRRARRMRGKYGSAGMGEKFRANRHNFAKTAD